MSKFKNGLFIMLLGAAMAFTLLLVSAADVKAEVDSPVYEEYSNGSGGKTNTDANGITMISRCKLWLGDENSVDYGFKIGLPKGAAVKSVKSSSSKLKANIVCNAYSVPYVCTETTTYSDGRQGEISTDAGETSNRTAYIGLYATKKGNYKLTVTIALADSRIVTKTVIIKVIDRYEPVYIVYGGYSYNKKSGLVETTKKSGKLTVKKEADITINKIEFANKFNAKGEPVFKRIKNKKKVTLNTKKTKTVSLDYLDTATKKLPKNVTQTTTSNYVHTQKITYSYLFAYSEVRISYTDRWTKKVYDVGDANKDGEEAMVIRIYYIK